MPNRPAERRRRVCRLLGLLVALVACSASAQQTLLFDQMVGVQGYVGLDITDASATPAASTREGADDFVVPAGTTWRIQSIRAAVCLYHDILEGCLPELESDFAGPEPMLVHVSIYPDANGLPAAQPMQSGRAHVVRVASGVPGVVLEREVTLHAGRYWLGLSLPLAAPEVGASTMRWSSVPSPSGTAPLLRQTPAATCIGWCAVSQGTGEGLGFQLFGVATASVAQVFADGLENACLSATTDDPACIHLPPSAPPSIARIAITADVAWTKVDVYPLVDRSGSMASENNAFRDGLAAVTDAARCLPYGHATQDCYGDAWIGLGALGYREGLDPFQNIADAQPMPDFRRIPVNEPNGCCREVTLLALTSTVTGIGSEDAACAITDDYPTRSCSTSEFTPDGSGYACFRPDAIPVVVLLTDEAPDRGDTYACPAPDLVTADFVGEGAALLGLIGSTPSPDTADVIADMATAIGTVDSANGGSPIVLDAANGTSAVAFGDALERLRNNAPLRVSALLRDDPHDAIDTSAFVARIAVVNDGSDGCPLAATTADTDGDAVAYVFLALPPGTRACFRAVLQGNTSVPLQAQQQLAGATFEVLANERAVLSSTPVRFVLPPDTP